MGEVFRKEFVDVRAEHGWRSAMSKATEISVMVNSGAQRVHGQGVLVFKGLPRDKETQFSEICDEIHLEQVIANAEDTSLFQRTLGFLSVLG